MSRPQQIPLYQLAWPDVDTTRIPTLDVGCGNAKLPGATGIDLVPDTQADITHDLSKFPWPLPDSSYEIIRLWSVLEHLEDVVGTLQEVHRVARPGAVVHIGTPHFSSANAFTDPTHRHQFSARFLDYMVEGTELNSAYGFYGAARFQMEERRVTLTPYWHKLRMSRLINRHLAFYETYLCFLIRGSDIMIKLRVVK